MQQLSGTYTIQLGPNILDTFGQQLDTNQNAGLDVLRGQSQNGPTTTVHYTAADLPKADPAPTGTDGTGQVELDASSCRTISSSRGTRRPRAVSGMQVQLNLTYPNDPDLTATLYHYDPNGDLLGSGRSLFSNVGQRHHDRQFHQHGLRRQRGHADPERRCAVLRHVQPAAVAGHARSPGMNAQGTWTLVIQNASTAPGAPARSTAGR